MGGGVAATATTKKSLQKSLMMPPNYTKYYWGKFNLII